MMKNALKIYLTNAKYIVFLIKPPPNSAETIKPSPLILSNILKSNNLNAFSILQKPFTTNQNIKKNLFSSQPIRIDLVNAINNVTKEQNLHLLDIGKIYYANQGKPIKGWKLPRVFQVSSQFQAIFNSPVINISKGCNRRYKVIKGVGIGIIQEYESFQEAEKDNLALEKQHSRRRNYLTSRPLHT
jgi:hypothetical protein